MELGLYAYEQKACNQTYKSTESSKPEFQRTREDYRVTFSREQEPHTLGDEYIKKHIILINS